MVLIVKGMILCFLAILYGCAAKLDSAKLENGGLAHKTSRNVDGVGFSHKIWLHQGKSDSDRLTIYIHGDGQPWLAKNKIAKNPTTEHAYTFALWELDSGPAFLLGRPCYFSEVSAACHPGYWTNARYSSDVVTSLAEVINHMASNYPKKTLRLVGFSGGGVLAALLSIEVERVSELVTIAAPLDVVAWTKLHKFSPLDLSENPADYMLPKTVAQVHFVGGRDKNVPAELSQRFYKANGISPTIIEGYSHTCCWGELWREHQAKEVPSIPVP